MSIFTLGIDIGSTASKCVIIRDGEEIVAKALVAVGAGTSGPQRAIAQVLENAGMTKMYYMPYDFVADTFTGDWRDATLMYRSWAIRQKW